MTTTLPYRLWDTFPAGQQSRSAWLIEEALELHAEAADLAPKWAAESHAKAAAMVLYVRPDLDYAAAIERLDDLLDLQREIADAETLSNAYVAGEYGRRRYDDLLMRTARPLSAVA